jgi:hypothetical protein
MKPGSLIVTRDRVIAAVLALATAVVVVIQNARLTVLWDLSYILENATRIAMGDVPYRDFPFPYAPLTFVTQALIIRLFGRALWHHVAYAAVGGGLASAMTYLVIQCTVHSAQCTGGRLHLCTGIRCTVHSAQRSGGGDQLCTDHCALCTATALLLTLPLIPLGIYCVFPHPFYDPDCCLVILAIVFALQRSAARFAIGVACVVPLLVKQNIGLAFLIAVVVLAVIAREWRLLAGIAAGCAAALTLVATVFGLDNYVQWTIRFAAARRLPPLRDVLSIYVDETLLWWLACIGLAALLMRWNRAAAACVACIPFVWSIARIFLTDDPLEREINLLRVWPLVLVAAAIAGLFALARRDLVPLLLIAAIHGAFLSQSTWGSTYGIWPLLVILAAYVVRGHRTLIAAAFCAALLFGGIPYVVRSERLTYAKLDMPWRGDFAQLVAWTDAHIPRNDAILSLPGEDLFYFTTGRRPRFPVLMFDRTVNPYDAATLDRLARERGVRWVIVKHRLQLNGTPMENLAETLALIAKRGRVVAELRNYTVWQVVAPAAGKRPTGTRPAS